MRLGLMGEALVSFEAAQALVGVTVPESLRDNLAALEEHRAHLDEGISNYDYEDDDVGSSVGATTSAEKITKEAISLADSGNLVGALALFKNVIKHNPSSSTYYENRAVSARWFSRIDWWCFSSSRILILASLLQVTEMRLGLLDAARKTLAEAESLNADSGSERMAENIKALKVSESCNREFLPPARSLKARYCLMYTAF